MNDFDIKIFNNLHQEYKVLKIFEIDNYLGGLNGSIIVYEYKNILFTHFANYKLSNYKIFDEKDFILSGTLYEEQLFLEDRVFNPTEISLKRFDLSETIYNIASNHLFHLEALNLFGQVRGAVNINLKVDIINLFELNGDACENYLLSLKNAGAENNFIKDKILSI